jgi:transcription antitermination factor NusG
MIHLDKHTERWFAVCTRYKCEKYVTKLLTEKGIQVYLPLQKRDRFWGKRRRIVELPLISCYVFVKIKLDQYVPVLETENILKFVKTAKDLVSIPEQEIDILKRVVGDMELEISVEPLKYEIGDNVEIVNGSLIGMKGKLVETNKNKFVIIELLNIGLSLRIKVHNNYLRKIAD